MPRLTRRFSFIVLAIAATLSRAGCVFKSFLIFFGVTTIFISIGAMTQTIIELEFGDLIVQRRNKRMIERRCRVPPPTPSPDTAWPNRSCGPTSCSFSISPPRMSART
jgi:hypothetical protein